MAQSAVQGAVCVWTMKQTKEGGATEKGYPRVYRGNTPPPGVHSTHLAQWEEFPHEQS